MKNEKKTSQVKQDWMQVGENGIQTKIYKKWGASHCAQPGISHLKIDLLKKN